MFFSKWQYESTSMQGIWNIIYNMAVRHTSMQGIWNIIYKMTVGHTHMQGILNIIYKMTVRHTPMQRICNIIYKMTVWQLPHARHMEYYLQNGMFTREWLRGQVFFETSRERERGRESYRELPEWNFPFQRSNSSLKHIKYYLQNDSMAVYPCKAYEIFFTKWRTVHPCKS